MLKLITKKTAEKICGTDLPNEGEAVLMPTGAKLVRRKVGAVLRYALIGYAYDNRDIYQLLD